MIYSAKFCVYPKLSSAKFSCHGYFSMMLSSLLPVHSSGFYTIMILFKIFIRWSCSTCTSLSFTVL